MYSRLSQRAEAAELMDDLSLGGAELREALRELRLLNRLFAAAGPTLYGIKRLWEKAGKPQSLTVLDVGAGSGDVNRKLLKWADRNGIKLSIRLLDVTEEACAEARKLYEHEPRVIVERGDLFQLPEEGADIVTGTQLLHHFEGERLEEAASAMVKGAKLGVVINDIHRHWLAWTAVWLVTRLFSTNRYIRNDGPLSVAKGFRAEDWRRLQAAPELTGLTYSWRPLFRYTVIINKPARAG
jgi:2-polyprenyl-3-methyl-5-hydroxy-6-metoxy-1,4-benzoquinol methylase